MKSFVSLLVALLLAGAQASILNIFAKPTTTTTTTTTTTAATSTDPNGQTANVTSATMTTTAPEPNSMLDTVMQKVWNKINGVGDILDQAAEATESLNQSGSLAKLVEMKNEMTQIGGALENLNFNNISEVATGLESVGKKLLGVSGNATEVKQQLLNAAVKGIADGTWCKSPAEIAASVAQDAMGTIMGNLPGVLTGAVGTVAGSGSGTGTGGLASAAAMVGTVAKAAEGAGALSQGMGVAVGALKCAGKYGAVVGTIASGGALAPVMGAMELLLG